MTSRKYLPLSIMIPVKDGGLLFEHQARHFRRILSFYDIEIIVVDSGSVDDSVRIARESGFRVYEISPSEFGHGKTRNMGVQLATREFICFITHDVLPTTPDWPEHFVSVFEDETVGGVYGRQVPRSASTMEMFFVRLNYPATPLRYDPTPDNHHPRPGRVLFSNAFSCARRSLLLKYPFPTDAPVSEDQMFAHQALQAGYSIVYEPKAEALHAHSYTLKGLYKRSFLAGKALQGVGLDRGASFKESVEFLYNEIKYVVTHGHSHWLPWILSYEFIRWLGFQAGRQSKWQANLPRIHKEI